MSPWSTEFEEELSQLLKDWLKQHGRTQADLKESLDALSTRMPAILEVLKTEYSLGGLPKLAEKLSLVEEDWYQNKKPSQKEDTSDNNKNSIKNQTSLDPFGQLDLVLQEIRDDCGDN